MTNSPTNIQIQKISLTVQQFEQLKVNLSQLQWTVFLESADTAHVDSKWTIISTDPIATLQCCSGKTTFKQDTFIEHHTSDPFALLKRKRELLFDSPKSEKDCNQQYNLENLPFTGGVLGAIDYELGYQFEAINNATQPSPLTLPELNLGFYDWALLQEQQSGLFYLMTHQTSKDLLSIAEHWQHRYQWLIDQVNIAYKQKPFKLCSGWQSNMDKRQYTKKFNQVQDYILSGDCYQVNLAQRFNASYQGDEYQAYQQLIKQNRPPFAAFLHLPEQVILSVSPERFLKLKNNIVESKPIKGTRPRFDDPEKDFKSQQALQTSEKDRSENLMIVDLLRNDIGRVCQPGSVKVPSLFEIESFPAVHHLVSTVVGQLAPEFDVEDLLRVSFPGGSITGAPKIRAMEIIAELEPHRRHSYCGSIGYINANGEMDMNIAIRTLVCVDGNIYCWAGGGLVADSQVDAEYQECFDKVSKILPCLTAMKG
jgi:para-aminobenzoate synthetase component 1